jgi:hypothetical protein
LQNGYDKQKERVAPLFHTSHLLYRIFYHTANKIASKK